VTFLCEKAFYDSFQKILTLQKAQVVNGGQTIRALNRSSKRNVLKPDVVVPARAITSSDDKDFANSVAVNQNNQNQIGTGFLRSNDKVVVQLDYALASLGWYLERREGELGGATLEERAIIEKRINHSLEGRVITLKEAAQAYTATFYGQPEVAKKNVAKIFVSIEDGGYYERIFSDEMTAERVIIAYRIKNYIDELVKKFAAARRKQQSIGGDLFGFYEPVVGSRVAQDYSEYVH
jgi:hypothetical protein